MLDLLLDAEKNDLIDDKGIKEEVATFIFAVIVPVFIFSISTYIIFL